MKRKSYIIFDYANGDDIILENLGMQLRQMRLNKNITQKQLSELSGLSRSAISDLENRGTGSMSSFIRVLRALDKLEILNHFKTDASVSPIQIAKLRGRKRKRASGIRTIDDKEEPEW